MEETNIPGVEPEDLAERFVRLEWLMRRHHLKSYHAGGPMATPRRGQGRILNLLKLKPEMTQKELSTILDIRPQSLGELLSKLERNGFIVRTPSESDRRGMNVRLTDEGRSAAEQPESSSEADSVFGVLDEAERAPFAAGLDKIASRLEELLGAEPEEFAAAVEHLRQHGFGGHHGHRHDRDPFFGGREGHSFFHGHGFPSREF